MYDVIVVGSGIAGSYIASQINAETLVLEKERRTILKDSGIVSGTFKDFFKDKTLIKQGVKEINFISPSEQQFSISSEEPFVYLLRRRNLSMHLRKIARKNAKLRYETVQKINYLPKW